MLGRLNVRAKSGFHLATSRASQRALTPNCRPVPQALSRNPVVRISPVPLQRLQLRWSSSFENAIDLRPGMIMQHKNKLVEVTKAQHTTNAQRSGYMQVEFKDVITGAKGADRFRSDEEVEVIELEGKRLQYVGPAGKKAYKFRVLDEEEEEEVEVPSVMFPNHFVHYAQDDVTIMAGMHDGKVVKWKFEETKKVFTVKDAGAVGRDTTHSAKPITLSNGRTIKAPSYIETGEQIIVNIETETFVGRA